MTQHWNGNRDGSTGDWVRAMRQMETEGERSPVTYDGQPLVRIGDVYVTAETALEILEAA